MKVGAESSDSALNRDSLWLGITKSKSSANKRK